MRNMEKEAYLKGNMCFRDWEDEYKLTLKRVKIFKGEQNNDYKNYKTISQEKL